MPGGTLPSRRAALRATSSQRSGVYPCDGALRAASVRIRAQSCARVCEPAVHDPGDSCDRGATDVARGLPCRWQCAGATSPAPGGTDTCAHTQQDPLF
jgi:hypothetical protein